MLARLGVAAEGGPVTSWRPMWYRLTSFSSSARGAFGRVRAIQSKRFLNASSERPDSPLQKTPKWAAAEQAQCSSSQRLLSFWRRISMACGLESLSAAWMDRGAEGAGSFCMGGVLRPIPVPGLIRLHQMPAGGRRALSRVG